MSTFAVGDRVREMFGVGTAAGVVVEVHDRWSNGYLTFSVDWQDGRPPTEHFANQLVRA